MHQKETIGSHFVWRKYLEHFSVENRICVFRKSNKSHFCTTTQNIAKKNHIYDLSDITGHEATFLKQLANYSTSFPNTFISGLVDDFIFFINSDISELISRQDYSLVLQELMLKHHAAFGLKRKNGQELLFTFYENNYAPIYDGLLNKDASCLSINKPFEVASNNYTKILIAKMSMLWWAELIATMFVAPSDELNDLMRDTIKEMRQETDNIKSQVLSELLQENQMSTEDIKRFDFLTFVLSQSLRTQRNYKTLYELMTSDARMQKTGIRPQVTNCYMNHIGIHQIALSLIKSEFKMVFLVNNTSKNLITGDQPVVNTHADYGRQDELLELYYPLSPKLGILYTDRGCYAHSQDVNLTEQDVCEYNRLLRDQCEEFCYCKSQVDLPHSN
jgi:hypothetical protein